MRLTVLGAEGLFASPSLRTCRDGSRDVFSHKQGTTNEQKLPARTVERFASGPP